jgi:hypothetical protein
MTTNETILLTGATGYLGKQLLINDYNVIALHLNHNENFSYDKKYEKM